MAHPLCQGQRVQGLQPEERERIGEWREHAEVFAYFNNDWDGFAVDNALWLKRRLPAS